MGAVEEDLERHVSRLDSSSFAGRIATNEETTSLWDAEVTELTVSKTLRRSGIHSLLGVRLPPRHRLRGVMHVGVTEKRAFTAREIHRLQSLGQHLTVHLDNARLYGNLHATIDKLTSERELRETFVSVLAHDLRGPLAAAKMSSQVLMRHPIGTRSGSCTGRAALGNCFRSATVARPLRPPRAGLVITHGVGPCGYVLGTILLDLETPERVIGQLQASLLEPVGAEREGYVPTSSIRAASMLNGEDLLLLYGISDGAVGVAVICVADLLRALRAGG